MDIFDKMYTPFKDGDQNFYDELLAKPEAIPPINPKKRPEPLSSSELEEFIMDINNNIEDVRRKICLRKNIIDFYRNIQNAIVKKH